MTRPRVDVGVVTWNSRELTADALRRLLDSDQGVDVRVLVRDNGSSDGTPDMIRERVPEADLDAGAENLGFAAGMNTLIERSDAPWFVPLNSDAWPEPGALGALVECAERHPRAAVVAPRVERPDGTLEHSTHPFPSLRLAALLAFGPRRLLRGERGRRRLLEGAWDHREERSVDWAVGAALLMRRDALDELGGFDESFFMYAEDLEWCWRAWQRGWEVWFTPAAKVVHVGNVSGAQAYGARRTATYLHNTYRWLRRERGTLTARAYLWLGATGARRNAWGARRRGDEAGAAHWETVARAHRSATDAGDRPGATR